MDSSGIIASIAISISSTDRFVSFRRSSNASFFSDLKLFRFISISHAIDTVKKLINTGINAKLLLVGIKLDDIPANYRNLPWVEYFGFMNKNMPEQYQRYVDAIKRSHLLLLPTSAECSAIVFSEAAAYGLPVFTYDTGGIGNYVIDGYNGYRLRLGASANDFSVKIKETLFDGKLTKLSGNALQLYADNLSWSAWSRRFRGIIEEYENNK